MLVRRLVLVFSIVFCGILALAVGVAGAGGGLGPGQFTFKSQSASAFIGGKGLTPQPTFSVFVNRGLNSFEPEDGSGTTTVINNTIVIFSMFKPDGTGGFGCFVVAPSDFVVSDDLQSASLHTDLTAPNQCPGFGKPIGPVSQTNAATMAGGAGKGGGLMLPIRVDLTWTGANIVSNTNDQFSYTCLDRQTQGQNTFRDSLSGSASGTIAGVSIQTLSADVASQDGQLEIQGVSTPPCFG